VQFSKKGNIEPHPVTAEAGPKKVPAGLPDHRVPPEDDKLFDIDQLRQSVAFVIQAVRRQKVTAAATFVLVFGAVATIASLWPKTYEADGRLLMQRNEVTASLVNPGRTIPREAESPTLAAREIVLGRENVLALMKATNLLEEWERTRAPLLRFKDWLFGLFRAAPTEDERIDALAGLIEDRLQVGTSEEGAVSFFIRWPDPQMAFRLVDEAMKSFLEYRRINETAAINESIAILDRSANALETQITETVAQLPQRPTQRQVVRRPPPARSAGPSPQSTVQLSRMKSELEARQQEITRMAASRSQQLSEARGQLTTARTIYTEDHPTVLTLRQMVEQLSRDSPELAAARRDARQLEEEYDALSITVGVATEAAQSRTNTAVTSAAPPVVPFSLLGVGDESDPVGLRLRVEIAQLAAVRERANAARAELASAQAGFKYRYSVTRPARVPRHPSGPNVAAIILLGAIASLVLAIGIPVARRVSGL
jgi:uncharacterized protein involved in exopolysaccharide biosynthesis